MRDNDIRSSCRALAHPLRKLPSSELTAFTRAASSLSRRHVPGLRLLARVCARIAPLPNERIVSNTFVLIASVVSHSPPLDRMCPMLPDANRGIRRTGKQEGHFADPRCVLMCRYTPNVMGSCTPNSRPLCHRVPFAGYITSTPQQNGIGIPM